MTTDDQKTVVCRAADRDIKRDGTTDVKDSIEHSDTPVTRIQNSDWSILFDALDAFEADFRLEREQPVCGR